MTQPTAPNSNIRDVGVSIIRTVVPGLWGSALAWLATQVPAFEPVLNAPGMAGIGSALAGALILAWYSLFRSIEGKLPAWLTVLVLGANTPPTYQPTVPGTVNWARDEPRGLDL